MNVNKHLTPVRACRNGPEDDELAFRATNGLPVRPGELSMGLELAGNLCRQQPALTQFENISWQIEEWRVSVHRFAPNARKGAERPWFYYYPIPEKILSWSPSEYADHLLGA